MFLITANARALLRFLAAIACLLVAVPAMAQQTTGSIRVLVSDVDDLPIPGAQLDLTGDRGTETQMTNDLGQFVFTALLPGTYEVDVTKSGFNGVKLTNVIVNVGRETTLPVQLVTGSGVEDVVVIGQQTIDTTSTSRAQVLTKDFLQKVPTGRSYQAAVQMANGVQGGANPNMAGSASNENTYMLDGATITDPVTGTFSVNFNFDAIQQIEVILGGYMPEYGTAIGGVVNLVTESGTNNLEFNVTAFYTNGEWSPRIDDRYTADGFLLAPTTFDRKLQALQISSLVSGPVVKDKAWFIISYQGVRNLSSVSGVSTPRDFDGHYVLAKLTVQPSTEHRFTGFLQMNPTNIDNLDQSIFTRAEAQQRQAQGGFVTQTRWQWFLSPEANLDTQIVIQKTFIEVGAVPCTHDRDLGYHPCKPDEEENSSDWETPGRVGLFGAYSSVNYGSYYFDDRYRYQASTKLSLLSIEDPLGGTHDVKFGIEGVQLVWDQLQGYSGNTLYIDINQTFFDPLSLTNYYWLEITGPITYRTTGSQFNAFAQDSWKPVSNLTINYGSRVDNFVMRNDIGEPVVTGTVFGPRLFAAWDPFKDQKTKVAAGWGRFNDTGTLDIASFTAAGNYGSKLWLGEYLVGADGYSNGFASMYDFGPRENLNTSLEDLRSPRVDEVLLTLEREVVDDVAFFSNVTGKFTRNIYEFDETNLIYDSDGSTVIGSRYDDPTQPLYRLRTPVLAKRDYYQWDLGVRKVDSHRWASSATYTYSNTFGSTSGRAAGDFSRDPQTQYNYGPLLYNSNHVVKVLGYWDLPTDPWKQTVGAFFQYSSGIPVERLYWAEADPVFGSYSLRVRPRGTYLTYNPEWFLNVSFSQEINVRKGKFQVTAEALNITNNQAPSFFDANNLYQNNRLFAVARQQPLTFNLSAEYNF